MGETAAAAGEASISPCSRASSVKLCTACRPGCSEAPAGDPAEPGPDAEAGCPVLGTDGLGSGPGSWEAGAAGRPAGLAARALMRAEMRSAAALLWAAWLVVGPACLWAAAWSSRWPLSELLCWRLRRGDDGLRGEGVLEALRLEMEREELGTGEGDLRGGSLADGVLCGPCGCLAAAAVRLAGAG